jgi:hypothetical protein
MALSAKCGDSRITKDNETMKAGIAEKLSKELLRWWSNPDVQGETPEWLSSAVTFDSGLELLCGHEVTQRVISHAAWENIEILDAFGNGEKAALVFEGIDPVTLLKHRSSWVISIVDGKVHRILAIDSIMSNPHSPPRRP